MLCVNDMCTSKPAGYTGLGGPAAPISARTVSRDGLRGSREKPDTCIEEGPGPMSHTAEGKGSYNKVISYNYVGEAGTGRNIVALFAASCVLVLLGTGAWKMSQLGSQGTVSAEVEAFNCTDGTETAWGWKKAAWCCQAHEKGCSHSAPVDSAKADPYNCTDGTETAWGFEKAAFCCHAHKQGCVRSTPAPPKAPASTPSPAKEFSYVAHKSLNCPPGAHGENMGKDTDATAAETKGFTIEECQAYCSAEESCECFVRDVHTGECWRRGKCELTSSCFANPAYDVFVKGASAMGAKFF